MAGLRPGHPRLPYLSAAKTWMPGIADKFTQSAQGRLLWPGMTSFATEADFIGCFLSQTLRSARSCARLPTRGAYHDRHGRGVRMRWTRQRFARDGIAGWVGERPVSDQQRADEGCCSVRRSRVVLTPRRWRQVRGGLVGPTGRGQSLNPLSDGGKRARSPGRARRKPLKPLRAGTPGDSGVLVVARVRSITTSAHEAAGATGIRRSPRPLRAKDSSTPRAHCAARS